MDLNPRRYRNRNLMFDYGQVTAAEAVIIFLNGQEPLLGTLGSEGAKAMTGREGPESVQSNRKGSTVS
jgi:hypothetical protein